MVQRTGRADAIKVAASEPGNVDINNILNWLTAGTDAHAKNYSLLLGQNGAVRLAPFYDFASILPYPSVDTSKVNLAMKVGGEYRLQNIGLRHWQKLAATSRLDDAALIDRIRAMTQTMPGQAAAIQKQIEEEGLSHATITRWECENPLYCFGSKSYVKPSGAL